MSHDSIDDQLRSAAADVRSGLDGVEAPAFRPPSPVGSRVALVAAVALILGGGWWLTRPDDQTTNVDVAVDDTVTTASTKDPTEPTLGPVVAGNITAESVAASSMQRPDLGTFSLEPDFGTSIRRLTDSAPGEVIQPVWARTQAFNADGSLILLYRTGDGTGPKGHVVIDAKTGALVTELDLAGRSDIENVSWHSVDPNVLTFQRSNELVDIDVRTNEITVRVVFALCENIGNGSVAGSTASGTSVVGLLCSRTDGLNQWYAFDRSNNSTIVGAIATIDAAPIPLVSRSGFVVVGDTTIVVLDDALEPIDSIAVEASSFTVAQDRSGNDVVVATVFGGPTEPGTALVVTLATGAVDVIVGEATGYPYPPGGTQLSTAATDAPYLVAISTNAASSGGVLENEIMLLDIDGADSVLSRLSHHRSSGADVGSWPGDSMVAVSPDGSRVLFSSDWGTGGIDTFVIDLTR